MTESLDVTPKTTEQNLIVRINGSKAKVTNNYKTALEVLYLKIVTDTKHRAALRQQSFLFLLSTYGACLS